MHGLSNRLARLMVGGALVAALIMAVSHGAEKGSVWYLKLALIIGLACVAIGEFLSWHNAASAWHERRLGSLMLWGILGAALSAGTLYTNFSSSAGNNETKAGVQKAAFVTQADTTSNEKELTAKKSRLEQRMLMKPARDPETARKAQEQAKGDPRWKLTNGCTDIKGKNTRAHCDAYLSAVADEKLGTEILKDAEELKLVEAELKAVREARAHGGPAVISEDQAAVSALQLMANVDGKTARQIDSMIVPILVQFMLLFGGICLANEEFRGKARKAWVDFDKWVRRLALLRDIISGKAKLPEVDRSRVLAARELAPMPRAVTPMASGPNKLIMTRRA